MSEARTEEPTPRHERRAREQGRAWQSRDLALGVVLLVAGGLAHLGAETTRLALTGLFRAALARISEGGALVPGRALEQAVTAGAQLALPLLAAVVGSGALVSAVQVGGLLAPLAVAPDASRLDPGERFGPGAGRRAASSVLLGALRLALVIAVVVVTLAEGMPGIATLARQGPEAALDATLAIVAALTLRSGLALLLVGVLDAIAERALFRASLRMTRRERERDQRAAEGDVHLRRERDRVREALHREGELEDVRGAVLLVTGEDELAVALAYDASDPDDVPRVVAVARDARADEVVREARDAGVPRFEDAALAARLAIVDAGAAIPESLYESVARAMQVRP